MRKTILAAAAVIFAAAAPVPAIGQQGLKGDEAVAIVTQGTIRASSSEGFQGFLLLIEYRGRNYTCAVTAIGQVQECFPLHW